MNNKVMYMTFYENWVEVMEMCTPEEWYELCKIITNLRFKGIDTDAKTISNLKIKMAWNLIRPSILKSNRDKRYNDTKRNGGNAEETKKSAITEVENNEFQIEQNTAVLSPSNNENIPTPQTIEEKPTEAIKTTIEEEVEINNNIDNDMGTLIGYIETPTQEEFDNYSDVLDKLLDDYESIINHTTDIIAKAELSDDIMIVYQAKQAKIKLKEISEKLIEEIDRTNFYKYINEKVGVKVKKLGYETV